MSCYTDAICKYINSDKAMFNRPPPPFIWNLTEQNLKKSLFILLTMFVNLFQLLLTLLNLSSDQQANYVFDKIYRWLVFR